MGVSCNLYPASVSPSVVEGLVGRRQLTAFTSSLRAGRHVRHILCRAQHTPRYTRRGVTASQRGLGAGDGFCTLCRAGSAGCAPMARQSCWGIEVPLTKAQHKCSSQSKARRKKNAGTLPALPGEFGSASPSRQAPSPWQQCSADPRLLHHWDQASTGAGRPPRLSLHLPLPPRKASCAKVTRGRT